MGWLAPCPAVAVRSGVRKVARILYENSGKTAAQVCSIAGVGRRSFFAHVAARRKAQGADPDFFTFSRGWAKIARRRKFRGFGLTSPVCGDDLPVGSRENALGLRPDRAAGAERPVLLVVDVGERNEAVR
jgi:hypothetical protein